MPVQRRVALGMMRTFQLTATFDNLSVVDNLVLAYFRAHRKSSMLQLFLNTCKGIATTRGSSRSSKPSTCRISATAW